MPELYSKKCKCTYCLKETETKRVLSRHIRVERTDFDSFVHYQGSNPYLYEPIQCSHCRFIFHESFEKLRTDVRQTLEEQILPTLPVLPFAATERTIEQALQLYKLALYTAQVTDKKKRFLPCSASGSLGCTGYSVTKHKNCSGWNDRSQSTKPCISTIPMRFVPAFPTMSCYYASVICMLS